MLDEIGRKVLCLVALLCLSVRSVTFPVLGVAGLQRPRQSLAASHSGRSLVNPPARCLHLLLCKTPKAEDAATAGYRGESQADYHTYRFVGDGGRGGDGDDDRPTVTENIYVLITCWLNSVDVCYEASKIHKPNTNTN